ncbi:hypothetical protein AAD018_009700 [Aestuariibius insulae]|uniref:hypothetical protein n=1 Tax=Aestuariibius insulae TaxID=2058287 RepID=UPI00345E421B
MSDEQPGVEDREDDTSDNAPVAKGQGRSDEDRLILTADQRVADPPPQTATVARARKSISYEPFLQTPALSLRAKIAELEQAVDRTFQMHEGSDQTERGFGEAPAGYSAKRPEWLRSRHRARGVQRFQSSTAVAYHGPAAAPAGYTDALAAILPDEGIPETWEVAATPDSSGPDTPDVAASPEDPSREGGDAGGATLRLVTPLQVDGTTTAQSDDSDGPDVSGPAQGHTSLEATVASSPPQPRATISTIPPAATEDTGEFSEEAWLTAGAVAQSTAFPPNEEDEEEDDDPLEDAVRAIASAVATKITLADPAGTPTVSHLPVAEPKMPEPKSDDTEPKRLEPDSPDAGLLVQVGAIDGTALRKLVAEIVREELQGHLGEAVTRNIRSLVRREINRALASHDLT